MLFGTLGADHYFFTGMGLRSFQKQTLVEYKPERAMEKMLCTIKSSVLIKKLSVVQKKK